MRRFQSASLAITLTRLPSVARLASAVGIGLGPGMMLPFAVSWRMATRQSDVTLLVLSVATAIIGMVASAVEATAIAAAGRSLRNVGYVSRATTRSVDLLALRWGAITTVVVGSLLGVSYGWGQPDPVGFGALVGLICIAPLVSAVAAVRSGALIARQKPVAALASQGFRALFPIGALVAGVDSVLVVVVLYVFGEIVRLVALGVLCRSAERGRAEDRDAASGECEVSEDGMPWQIGANAIGQIAPAVGRTLISPFVGAVTALELSEKMLAAATQMGYNFGLLPKIGAWSSSTPGDASRLFRRDSKRAACIASFLALIGLVCARGAVSLGVLPESWSQGLSWASIALLGAPCVAVSSGATRYIAVLGAQKQLSYAALMSAGLNVLLGIVLIGLVGGIGFVISAVVSRYALVAAHLWIVRRQEQANAAARRTSEAAGRGS